MKQYGWNLKSLLLLLCMTAGFTDTYFYMKEKVFPANMTGNTVEMAIAIGKHNWADSATPAVTLLGFIAGTIIGSFILDKEKTGAPEQLVIRHVLYSETIMLFVLQLIINIEAAPHKLLLVLLPSIAMGLQGVAVNRLGIKGVSTITLTGTITTAFNNLVYKGLAERHKQPSTPFQITILAWSWGSFVAGASIAILFVYRGIDRVFFVPLLLLIICIAFNRYLKAAT